MAIISEVDADTQPSNPLMENNQMAQPETQASKPMEKKEAAPAEKKPERLLPNKANGLDMDNYTWGQSLQELNISVPVPAGTKAKSVVYELKSNRIRVGLKNQDPILDGELFAAVKVDDCYWNLEDNKSIEILLTKQDRVNWWKTLVKGDPEIDTQKVEPEPSKLSDLEGETRATIEKMMFDQRQKHMGLPTSQEIEQQEMMKKFQGQFPNMDFSGMGNSSNMFGRR